VYEFNRSSSWLKIKNILTDEAIVCGYTKPQGKREGFGALLLGIYKKGKLTYVGHTGSGFDDKTLANILKQLQPLVTKKCPFDIPPKPNAPVTWVKPKVVAQVKYAELTREGVLRQAIFLGLREDKLSKEVIDAKPKQEMVDVPITHREKVYWPEEKYTKGDMVDYYDKISPYILPYLVNRLQSLNRFPHGIEGASFYQKDLISYPTWVRTVPVDHKGVTTHYLLLEKKIDLLYMANLGCIENLVVDLDPNNIAFKEVVRTALCIKEIFDKTQIESCIKTSGKRGLHILIPLRAKYTTLQVKQFAEIIAGIVHEQLPSITSVVRDPAKRQKKVYLDFLQNNLGQTITAPYSLRPVAGAPVSTPLNWSEVSPKLNPQKFTIKTIFGRLKKKGDVWKGFLEHPGIDMEKCLNLLEKIT